MALALPLAGWAEAQLEAIRALAGTPALDGLSGVQLLGERAALNGFSIPGRRSTGGGAISTTRSTDRSRSPWRGPTTET
ncbi:hypothetical protein ACFSUK_22385 [Sphingobium scionense]